MSKDDFMKRDLDDIVFEHRNRSYGAFQLRRAYGRRIQKASLIGVSAFLLCVSSPLIADKFKSDSDVTLVTEANIIADISKKPEKPPVQLPPPPPPKQKPIATVRFVPPRVVENEVPEEDAPIVPPVVDAAISTVTKEGERGENLVLPIEAPPSVAPPPTEPEVKKVEKDEPFVIVEEKPMFPNGELAMMRFLRDNIKYPPVARENGIEGTVHIRFVVSKVGVIEDIQVLRGVAGGCTEEALRVVKMMPTWKPGRQQGKAVPVYFTLPVKFKLE